LSEFWALSVVSRQETEARSVYRPQQSIVRLRKETKSYLRKVMLEIKDRTIDNVENCDRYIAM
jgi:hypothetical protein